MWLCASIEVAARCVVSSSECALWNNTVHDGGGSLFVLFVAVLRHSNKISWHVMAMV